MGIPYFEYFNTQTVPNQKWYWRLKDGNNKIIAIGAEPFSTQQSVEIAVRNVCSTVPHATKMYNLSRLSNVAKS